MKIKQKWERWTFGRNDGLAIGLALIAMFALTGCVGYVDGGYGGAAVVAPDPDVVVFGGGYDHGHYVHDYSHRGAVSRGGWHH